MPMRRGRPNPISEAIWPRETAANAAGYAAEDRSKVDRLKAGEDVDVGKPIDWRAILKGAWS
jgi:hypothetical protein